MAVSINQPNPRMPSSEQLLGEALRLTQAGYSVIPTVPFEKRPAVQWEEYTHRAATEQEIRSWWSGESRYGIAVVLGAASRCVVLDFDPADDVSAEDLVAEFESVHGLPLPHTCTVATPSGGLHYHYSLPKEGLPPEGIHTRVVHKSALGKVELRAEKSICVMPPTVARNRYDTLGQYAYEAPLEEREDISSTWLWSLVVAPKQRKDISIQPPKPPKNLVAAHMNKVYDKLSEEARKMVTTKRNIKDRSKLCWQFGMELLKAGVRDRYTLATCIMGLPAHEMKYADSSRGTEWDEWGHAWKLAGKLLEAVQLPPEDTEEPREQSSTPSRPLKLVPLACIPRETAEFLINPLLPRGEVTMLDGDPSSGKALALDTLIPTPDGFKTMGEIKVGDIVYDGNGQETVVTKVSPIFYDHKCYRVHFDDGTTVVADADHLWLVQTAQQRTNTRRWRNSPRGPAHNRRPGYSVLTTEEIAQSVKAEGGKRSNYSVDIKPFAGRHRELPIPPYVLGVWLGDGTARDAEITTADEEILQFIQDEGVPVGRPHISTVNRTAKVYRIGAVGVKNIERVRTPDGKFAGIVGNQAMVTKLRQLNLLNNKHIPQEYLFSSFEQRLELLQGLMDTDGTISKTGICEFTTTNKRLAEDVSTLLAGLGIKNYMSTKNLHNGNTAYRIRFTTDLPVFRLERKKARLPKKVSPRVKRRFITKVEEVDTVPTQCITVASPEHTYMCTNQYVVTHNSWAWMALLSGLTGSKVCPVPYDHSAPKDATAVILASEDSPTKTIRARLEDLGADLSKIMLFVQEPAECQDEDEEEKHNVVSVTAELLKEAIPAITDVKPDLVVIDPITLFVTTRSGFDINNAVAVRQMLTELQELARKLNFALLVVRHFRKSGGKALYRGLGSIDFAATARSEMIVQIDKKTGKHILAQPKCNLAPRMLEGLVFSLNPNRVPPFQWDGMCEVPDPDTLTEDNSTNQSRESTSEDSKLEFAKELLVAILSDSGGSALSRDIVKIAKQNGISDRTLWRAKEELGIAHTISGFGKDRKSVWLLPDGWKRE